MTPAPRGGAASPEPPRAPGQTPPATESGPAAAKRPAAGAAVPPHPATEAEEERPGDPVCLLRRVCPACGGVADEDPPTTCPQCHREIPDA